MLIFNYVPLPRGINIAKADKLIGLAEAVGLPGREALERLARGVALKDGPTQPCRLKRLEKDPELPARTPPIRFRRNIPTAWIEITLTEGRNRQVRRMTAAIGIPTLRLVRVSHGPFRLEGLQPGEWRLVKSGLPG